MMNQNYTPYYGDPKSVQTEIDTLMFALRPENIRNDNAPDVMRARARVAELQSYLKNMQAGQVHDRQMGALDLSQQAQQQQLEMQQRAMQEAQAKKNWENVPFGQGFASAGTFTDSSGRQIAVPKAGTAGHIYGDLSKYVMGRGEAPKPEDYAFKHGDMDMNQAFSRAMELRAKEKPSDKERREAAAILGKIATQPAYSEGQQKQKDKMAIEFGTSTLAPSVQAAMIRGETEKGRQASITERQREAAKTKFENNLALLRIKNKNDVHLQNLKDKTRTSLTESQQKHAKEMLEAQLQGKTELDMQRMNSKFYSDTLSLLMKDRPKIKYTEPGLFGFGTREGWRDMTDDEIKMMAKMMAADVYEFTGNWQPASQQPASQQPASQQPASQQPSQQSAPRTDGTLIEESLNQGGVGTTAPKQLTAEDIEKLKVLASNHPDPNIREQAKQNLKQAGVK